MWDLTVGGSHDHLACVTTHPIKRLIDLPPFSTPSLHLFHHFKTLRQTMPQTLNYGDFTVNLHLNMFPAGQHIQTKPSSLMTNTLVVAGISRSFFQNPTLVSILERHFQLFGHVHSWAPLPSFGRIMIVYYHDEDAERARQDFDSTALRHTHDWYVLANPCPPRFSTDWL